MVCPEGLYHCIPLTHHGYLYAQWYQIDPGAYQSTSGLVSSTCATIIFGN